MLIRVFLHAEFIFAMKKFQNPTIFMKKCKKKIEEYQLYRKAIAFNKIEVIMPYLQIQQKYAYYGIFACRIHICDENSSKSYDFREKCKKKKKIEKCLVLVISVHFLRFSLKLLFRISGKVTKKVFLDGKEDK